MSGVAIHLEGMPEVKRMLAEYSPREMQNRMRRAVRAGAQPFRGGLIAAAAAHHGGALNVPESFQEVGPPKVTTRGGESGRDIEAYVRPKSPLFNILEPGASAHTIAPGSSVTQRPGRRGGRERKALLQGPRGEGHWTAKGRKRSRAFFSDRPVHHPGLAGRHLLAEAFNAEIVVAEERAAAAIFGPLR